jgi:uncharacterized Zn finger protein
MTTIPKLSEQEIREFIGEQSFQRGQRYFSNGAIFDARRQGMTLKARCEGSRSEAYRVEVTFDTTHVIEVSCSCPIGGHCKHVAALLLTWQARPEEFLEEEDVDTILKESDKAELIALIKQMLRREPDLELLVQAKSKRQAQINPEVYRRQVETIFRDAGNEWGVEADIAGDLFEVKEVADMFAQRSDYANTALVYEVLIEGMLKYSSRYEDEDGELRSVIDACIEALDTCLTKVQDDSALREKMLQLLFAIHGFDIHAGGIGFGEEAPEILLGHATGEERQKIVQWTLDAIAQIPDKTSWERQQWGSFLLELGEETLDDEAFLRICRETGRVADAVERLLELGRVKEAVKETEPIGDYDLLRMADIFVKHEQAATIEPIMWKRGWKLQDMRLLEWLEKRYQARKDPATPLLQAGLNFLYRHRPTLESYRELRDVAQQFGQWEKIRPAAIAAIKPPYDDLVIRIALDENDIDMIINMLKVEGVPSYSYAFTRNRVFKVVQSLEETHPSTALAVYRAYVEYHIGQRNRQGYQEACWCLAIMRTLYNKLGKSDEWTNYITALRERYHTLRALKEELAKAKL